MSLSTLRHVIACLALLGLVLPVRGGLASFTDRGKTDFDTALQILNPYGTWSKIDRRWAYTPRDGGVPYTNGRWVYTEYGWYWKGNLPHSWATEHYGYWKRGANRTWAWYPGPFWLPEIVEIRSTETYFGWRSAAVDSEGDFVEAPLDRYSKTDEWTFVTRAQFANPITPAIIARTDVAAAQLEESTDCRHTYLTYREIDRPGPHPADLASLCRDGELLAPRTAEDVPSKPPPNRADPAATNAIADGTNPPKLLGTEENEPVDARQVKYWITKSLPTYWTPPPADAKIGEIYLYHPDFYQDEDGIARRIALWFNPSSRASAHESLTDLLGGPPSSTPSAGSHTPAAPATPAEAISPGDSTADPFRSPLDDSYHPSNAARSSSKTPPAPDAPIPLPVTNTAPVNAP